MENLDLRQLLNRYLQHCEVIRNYSVYTLNNYQSAFNLFFKSTGVKELNQFNKEIIQQWFFEGRLNRKWSSVTFRHYHKYLNAFCKWLLKEGLIGVNYAAEIEKPRLEYKIPRTLAKNDAQLVLDASFHIPYVYKSEKYRNRAIIGVMLLAGLRKKEVISLKLADISLENKMIFINQGKGNKDRIVPINGTLVLFLQEYLKDRVRLKRTSFHFFTCIQKDQGIGAKCINNLVRRIRQVTRISFSAHTLRHGFARLMLEGGCDIYTLSKIMGHSKITTTTIYLSCSSQQMLKSIEMHSLN